MIKFFCEACEKKIGVPDEFAGKLVRCPRCKHPARVPDPIVEDEVQLSELAPITLEADPDQGPDLFDGLESPAACEAPADELRCQGCNSPIHPDSEFCVQCGRPAPQPPTPPTQALGEPSPRRQERDRAQEPEATLAKRLPFVLVAAFIGAAIGAAVWGAIGYYTEFEFGIIAWGIGALVGLLVTVASKQESVFYGVLAVAFAISGIMAGKLLAVNWSTDKELRIAETQMRDFAEIIAQSDIQMFTFACMQLNEEGEIGDDWYLVVEYYESTIPRDQLRADRRRTAALFAAKLEDELGDMGPMLPAMADMGFDDEEETPEIPPDQLEKVQQAMQLAVARVKGWDQSQRVDMLVEMFIQPFRAVLDSIPYSQRLRDSLSAWDILWCLLALGSAYKLGEGGLI